MENKGYILENLSFLLVSDNEQEDLDEKDKEDIGENETEMSQLLILACLWHQFMCLILCTLKRTFATKLQSTRSQSWYC